MSINRSKKFIRSIFLSTALMFVAAISAPAATIAAAGTSGCATTSPTGSWASTFTYDQTTGLYENQYYTWDPSTCLYSTSPSPQTFTYNWSTGLWDGSQWDYSPASNSWTLDPVSVTTPPDGATLITPPNPALQTQNTISNTGSGSDNSINGTNNSTTNNTNNNNATVNNQLTSTGQSGDATVAANTTGGNATSGAVVTTADLNNLVQSSSALQGAATFVDNISGDVNGDIVVDPSAIVQPASGNSSVDSNNNLADNNTINSDASINNTATLAADSGDANVADNTNAGNATSGSADAVANVVNMINSMITSGQSFIGVINILGDLNGNILMPSQFLDSLIASNAPSSTVTISNNNNATLNAAFSNDEDIVNNVEAEAQSGAANSTGNTNAGDATSGNATTKVTLFNLTGDNVVAANTLLVFVNVSGTWVGLLMNAPAGATAAAFGSNVTENSTNNVNANLTSNNNENITNNLNVNANSGDATVKDNTNAGDATSGNADAAVNILNLEGSTFNASNWFGILFINVFGNWTGNFGMELPLATVAPPSDGGTTNSAAPNIWNTNSTEINKLFSALKPTTNTLSSNNNLQLVSAKLKTDKTVASGSNKHALTASQVVADNERRDSLMIGGVMVVFGIVLFTAERRLRNKTGVTPALPSTPITRINDRK
jgi:hypothetical protein